MSLVGSHNAVCVERGPGRRCLQTGPVSLRSGRAARGSFSFLLNLHKVCFGLKIYLHELVRF